MGKRSSWFTKEGYIARKQGITKERKELQIAITIFFCVCAILYISIGGVFAERSSNAMSINSDFTN